MLQVQGLSVEVGGRLVVADASFTVMARDKVGLVGRNGAGKTSLFKVLGGEAEPAAGRVIRKGGFGYLPQDPRIDPALDEHRNAVTHVLSGRGIDDALVRIEKLRIAMEEDPSERNVARYSQAQDEFATSGGYAAESEAAAHRRRARPARRPPRPARSACCPAASAGGSSCRASSSPAATRCCSTSRPTTSTSTPRPGCSTSCAPTAGRCW